MAQNVLKYPGRKDLHSHIYTSRVRTQNRNHGARPMSHENFELMVRRGDPDRAAINVAVSSQVYASLMRQARIREPSPTSGALIGNFSRKGEHNWIIVNDTEPVGPITTGRKESLDLREWDRLNAELRL